MRKLGAFALATVLACALPASAQAVPIIDFNGTSGAFKNTSIAAGDFDDTYKFDVSDMGIVSGTITSIAVDFVTNIDFSSVMLNGVEFSNLISGETEFRRITNLPVSGGEQTLRALIPARWLSRRRQCRSRPAGRRWCWRWGCSAPASPSRAGRVRRESWPKPPDASNSSKRGAAPGGAALFFALSSGPR
jgi:hypothetical protein